MVMPVKVYVCVCDKNEGKSITKIYRILLNQGHNPVQMIKKEVRNRTEY